MSTRCVVVSAGERARRVSAACIRSSLNSAYTHPASRVRALGASVGASRVRVESQQRSRLSALQRASLRGRGRGRTLFQAVHGTLAGLRTASRSASSASKSQSGAERQGEATRTVRGSFQLWKRHGGHVVFLDACLSRSKPRRVDPDERKRLRKGFSSRKHKLSSNPLHAPFEQIFRPLPMFGCGLDCTKTKAEGGIGKQKGA